MQEEVTNAAAILQRHRGKALSIIKRELGNGSGVPNDTDNVTLQLEDISVRDCGYTDSDGYVARQELILHGQGSIASDTGNYPLPQNAYEIPLGGLFSVRETATGLDIETDRALYIISFHP